MLELLTIWHNLLQHEEFTQSSWWCVLVGLLRKAEIETPFSMFTVSNQKCKMSPNEHQTDLKKQDIDKRCCARRFVPYSFCCSSASAPVNDGKATGDPSNTPLCFSQKPQAHAHVQKYESNVSQQQWSDLCICVQVGEEVRKDKRKTNKARAGES